MSREAVELQLVNYYAREGYYHHLQVRKQCTYFPRLREPDVVRRVMMMTD